MSDVIEVTQAMLAAGVDAVNKLRSSERFVQRREDVEMTWADLLSAAYAAMEMRRRTDEMLAELMKDVRPEGRA